MLSRVVLLSPAILLSSSALANVLGADQQNFNPTTDGLDFVTVESSETLEPGVMNFGLFVNHAVNALPRFDEPGSQTRTRINDMVTGADLNAGIGILKDLDAGISFPEILYEEDRDPSQGGRFDQRGNTEIRVNAKYRLLGDSTQGIATTWSVNFDRIADDPYTGRNPRPIYNLELAGDTTLAGWRTALNAGYRWRHPGPSVDPDGPIQPLQDQMIASVATSRLIAALDTKLILEVFGSRPVKYSDDETDRSKSSAEALVGLKRDFSENLALHVGGGSGLYHGLSSPDWRVYAGANYALDTCPKIQVVQQVPDAPPKAVTSPFTGPPKPFETFTVQNIIFAFDSTEIVNADGDQLLADLAAYLKRPPVFTDLLIVGHTDSIGSSEYNQKLSERRAEAIRSILAHRYGLDPSKITAEGKGASEPIADNGNYQGRQLNRRVQFVIQRTLPQSEAPAAPAESPAAQPAVP